MTLSLDELQAKPSILVDLLRRSKSVRLVHDSTNEEQVFVYSQTHQPYPQDVVEIVAASEQLYLQRKKDGFSREDAFSDIRQIQQEMHQSVNAE